MNKKVKEIVASYTSASKKLKEIVPSFNWSNLLADYGEYVCIENYGLKQAPVGTKGFDAKNKKNKTVQIKTVRDTTKSIKFSSGADYLLVIEVDENANWEEVYYGNFKKIIKTSYPTKNGEYTVGISKLKKIAANTFSPREEISVTLKNGNTITAPTRKELREKLISKGYKVPGMSTINQRIRRDNWKLERAFGIQVPPNYVEVEHFIDNERYNWFPKRPTQHGDREPLVYKPQKRVYVSHNSFCKDKKIPNDYLSDKLKQGWNLSDILNSYYELKR